MLIRMLESKSRLPFSEISGDHCKMYNDGTKIQEKL